MSRFWHITEFANSLLKKSQPTQIDQTSLLPNDVGCRIIQMEIETIDAQNLTKQIIMSLVSQYNKAIEFYQQKGSQKYLLYQKKLQSFILRPSIAEVLQGNTAIFQLKKYINQQELKKIQNQSNSQVKKLIQSSQNSGKKQQEIINSQLKNQQKDLEQRIKRKRVNSHLVKRKKLTTASFSHPSSQKQISDQPNDIRSYLAEFVKVPDLLSFSDKKPSKKLAF